MGGGLVIQLNAVHTESLRNYNVNVERFTYIPFLLGDSFSAFERLYSFGRTRVKSPLLGLLFHRNLGSLTVPDGPRCPVGTNPLRKRPLGLSLDSVKDPGGLSGEQKKTGSLK